MNSAEVAKLLGVSVSTIQRWVKQLNLPMERNERGHYFFNNDDIQLLKEIKEQLQNGVLLQDIAPIKEIKPSRKGVLKTIDNNNELKELKEKVKEIEVSVHSKADSVVSYQLLQHRREIEELQENIKNLTNLVEKLQTELTKMKSASEEKPFVLSDGKVKRKKKNIVSSFFSF
jgi:chromosome-anchoring protein RacA